MSSKWGHKQVVNMIRHGGNHLIIKVVTVSRNLDPDDTARKKGKRLGFIQGLWRNLLIVWLKMKQTKTPFM